MQRPSWDEYFLNIATEVAKRSSCKRNNVGAVIVKGKDIISTGYNGAPKYQKNCVDMDHCYRNENSIQSGTQLEKCRAAGSHAESNAISLCARNGNSTKGATIYIVGHNFVCNQCKGMIANADIARVVLRTMDGEKVAYYPDEHWTKHPIDE
jgi:dCMP deaminase